MSLLQIAVIAVAFVVAGVAKGAIGMGMPPIAIGLMSFAVPLESAIAIMVVPTMVTNIWQAIYGGGFRPLMRRFEPWANPVIGIVSGAVAGSTGVAAVPFLPYMQSLDMDRHELVQALGIMFLFITGMLAVSLALHGAYHLANSVAGVAAVAPTMLGVWLGQHARRRLSAETFRKIFIFGMMAVGLHLARALL